MSYRDGSPNPGNQLYIRGLNFRTTELELRDIFHPFGDIEEVHIVKDPHLNECRGFAFVKFVNNEMAQRALKKVDGMDFHGHRLIVELSKRSKPRQKTPGEYLGRHRLRSRSRRHNDYDRQYRDRSPYGGGNNGHRRDRSRGGYDSYSGRGGGGGGGGNTDDRYRRDDYRGGDHHGRDSYRDHDRYRERERDRDRDRDRDYRGSDRRYDDRHY
ncbi:hypothetical protein HMI54_011800 [Coelomomyces lativittatus]|nr:hypothetical protein HMI54_011800 [Coelomomyces lativittatus]